MNNEKLVDAIGLLDDEMIIDARNPKIRRYPTAVKAVAAVLAVLLVSAGVVFGAGKILGNLGADAADPKYRYAFTEEALAGICRQSMYSVATTSDPPVGATIGAAPPEILYADEKKVVFLTYEGVYVYDYIAEQLDTSFSFEKIGVPNSCQGDKTTRVSVSKDGKYMLLTSSENMSSPDRKLEYRIVRLQTADIDILGKNETPDFDAYVTEKNIYLYNEPDYDFIDANDFAGSKMASVGDRDFFVMVNSDYGAVIGNTELVIVNSDGTFTSRKVFAKIFEEYTD